MAEDLTSRPPLKHYAPLARRLRRRSVSAVTVLAISGVFEAFGVLALLPMLSGGLDGQTSLGSLTKHISTDETTLAWVGLIAVLSLGVLAIGARSLGERLLYRAMAEAENSVRADLATALLHVQWSAVPRISIGETSSSMMVATGKIGQGYASLLQAGANVLVTLPFVGAAIAISPTLTLLTLGAAASALAAYRAVAARAARRSAELNETADALATAITETFGHLKYIRSSGMLERFVQRMLATFRSYDEASFQAVTTGLTSRASYELAGLTMVGAVLIGTVVSNGSVSVSTLVLLALFFRLSPRLQGAQTQLHLARLGAAWLVEVLNKTSEARSLADSPAGTDDVGFKRRVEFRNVSFSYGPSAPAVLDNVSLRLESGECLAIVGPSGGGKTTLLDLLTGLLRPTTGDIFVDGQPLGAADAEHWRRQIAVVLQDSPVFHDTAARNIGIDDETPDLERVRGAIESSHARFLDDLSEGLHTVLGERGSMLSGGQRQRIAIARALYRSPSLLVLDEATSALDTDTETAIQETLASLRGKVTIVLVAHRLTTVKIADRIVVMERGRIAETGSWQELSQDPASRFYSMLEAQRMGEPGERPTE